MKKSLIGVMVLLALLASCEKFEEGGTHYASSRNILGTWAYQSVSQNGAPVADSVFNALYARSSVTFDAGTEVHYQWRNAADSLFLMRDGSYVFNYNKKKMSIVFATYPLDEVVYEVKKLTKDEFWVECAENDSVRTALCFIKTTGK